MKILLRLFSGLAGLILLFFLIYILGPRPVTPDLNTQIPSLDHPLSKLEETIRQSEAQVPNIKPGNAAQIFWADDSIKQKTRYAIAYLHGYSASHEEGTPVHKAFAKRYGCNMYLSRLDGHGVESEDAMQNVTPESLIQSAKRAIAIAKLLGDSVILMGTSTGCSYALYLASGNPDLHSLILYSPNVRVADPRASLLAGPWGLQLAKLLKGNYHTYELPGDAPKYWTTKYRVEALITMQSLIESTMQPEVFSQINQPVFMGYYFKNEQEQDHVVSVPKMLEMFEQLGTPEHLKRKKAFPNAKDHAIPSKYLSEDYQTVMQETFKFAEEILHLKPIDKKAEPLKATIEQID